MKPNDCEFTSTIKSNSAKRSFSKINQSNTNDNNINCKKKKTDKNSLEDINITVSTTSNGYMTRNKLKNQLADENELKKCLAKDGFTKHDTPKKKSRTVKRIRNPPKIVQRNKLNLGYIFTHDIVPEKKLVTQHKKCMPSLFESDSESEVESYNLNNSVKVLDEHKEKPIDNSELEYSAFNKNNEVKTYKNKKTYSLNHVSNGITSNICKEINETDNSSSFCHKVENKICSNLLERLSQNEKKCYDESLEISEPIMSVEDNIHDERMIVTDSFIRELEKEILIENTHSQGVPKTQEISHRQNDKSMIFKTKHDLNTKVNSQECEEISLGLINTPRVQEMFNDTHNFTNIELHLNTEMDTKKPEVLALDCNNLKLNSKCQCKIFYSFNKDANKILTSKTMHFVFNNNSKKARQKLYHQKQLEANNLKMLITGDKKYIVQPGMCLPTINSIPIDVKYEKCINSKENDHINEPSILNMLKNVYVDGDYLLEYNNKSFKLQKNNKINIQAFVQKPTDNKNKNDVSIFSINTELPVEKHVHFGQNIIIDNATTNAKLPDENCVNIDQNKNFDNDFESNITTNNENHFENLLDFGENKFSEQIVSSNIETNKKLHPDNHKNFDKNKITDDFTLSCFSRHKHLPDENYIHFDENEIADGIVPDITTNNENYNKNCLNFNEYEIIDNGVSSPKTIDKLCDENQINFVDNQICDKITLPSITKNKKCLDENIDIFEKDEIGLETFVSKSTINNKIHRKDNLNFGENKIIDDGVSSSKTSKKLFDENQINFVENQICDKINIPSVTKNKRCLDENIDIFEKDEIGHEMFVSKSTINNKFYSEDYLNFGENKIIDNGVSCPKTNEKLCVENQICTKISIPSITKNKKCLDENIDIFEKDEIGHEMFVSKSTINNKIQSEDYLNFGKNKIIDHGVSCPKTDEKLCVGNQNNFVENQICNKIIIPSITKNKKCLNESIDNFEKDDIGHEMFVSKSTTKNKIHNEAHLKYGENKIAKTVVSCAETKEKCYDENQINFFKNKMPVDINISTITGKNKKLDDKNQADSIKNKFSDDNIIVSTITTDNDVHDNKHPNLFKNKISDNVFTCIETDSKLLHENDIDFSGKNKIDCTTPHKIIEEINFVFDTDCMSSKMNFCFDSNHKVKSEENSIDSSDENCHLNVETKNCNLGMEIKSLNSLQSNNIIVPLLTENSNSNQKYNELTKSKHENILVLDTVKPKSEFIHMKSTQNRKHENQTVSALFEKDKSHENKLKLLKPPSYNYNCFNENYSQNNISFSEDKKNETCPLSRHVFEQPNKSLFDISNDDNENSLSSCSSADENKLQIEDNENNFEVNKNSTSIHSLNDNSNNSTITDNLPSDKNYKDCISNIGFSENEMVCSKNKQSTEISIDKNDIALKPVLLIEKLDSSNFDENKSSSISKVNKYFNNCITKEMCNDMYKKKLSIDNITNENKNFSKNIQDIFKEMYVEDTFVTACQHMLELDDYVHLKSDSTYFQTDNEKINPVCEKIVFDVDTQNDVNRVNSELSQSIKTNSEALFEFNMDSNKHENNKSSNINNKIINTNSKQKTNKSKSNMKIRLSFREFIKSNKSVSEILESKEFRNLRLFKEEEIACSIGVFIFEQTIEPPIINGLSSYKVNCDQLSNEEKNKLLGSTNLNIICPAIMKLTSITLALVKMLKSDTLIDLILNIIRKNLLNKQMNINHTIDTQLITQTVYYVDICIRLRLLKHLQTFIFDSMVLIPNKYCCVIFVSLLLWKNCLPRRMNNEQDPVIIMVMSYLIAKKKFYSEQIAGCDIFQRELINLLSFHFNYQFSTDLPVNFIQHVHKPDFFVSVVMFIKCCNPKDLIEFMVNCLFPIIEDYLKTQQNESNALKTMESIIIAIKPFKITCNTSVATYLKKYKGSINSSIKNDKEHVYNIMYNNYRAMQNKFIGYLNDYQLCSQSFEEYLVSIIMVLGSVDYLTSCVSLMKWKPKFEPSTILFKKIDMFKSVIGHNLWNQLCLMDDTVTIKCLVNSCLLKKNVYTTIVRLHALC